VKPIYEYTHIVWDWNGTLFDDVELCVDVMNGLLSRREMKLLTVDSYRDCFDFPVSDYYRRIGFDFEAESFEVVGTEFIREYEKRREEAGLHSDARETLARIQQNGTEQSVLSAYSQPMLEELVRFFSLDEYFVRLVGLSDHYAHGKLDNGIQWICELAHDPGEVLLVGDTTHDYEVAQAMGVDCVLVCRGHQSEQVIANTRAPVLGSLVQLRALTPPETQTPKLSPKPKSS
jgi:phosphoglycolate phosphatase